MSQPNDFDESTSLFCRGEADRAPVTIVDDETQAALAQEFETGSLLNDRYLLKQVLGSGGMGLVYLGHDRRLDRKVAIKIIPHRRTPTAEHLEQLLEREARVGAGLNHPNVATVLDFGLHGNRSYSVFEFVEGETLRIVLRRRGRLPLDEVCHVIGILARALDFAHSKGIVHRDLKPENVCVTPDGGLKILDLGIAHSAYEDPLSTGYFGTPAYSSPEQAQCRQVDGKSDQYALALIAFELLAGCQAFRDADRQRLLHRQIHEPPPSLSELAADLPSSVEETIAKALHKSPGERFASCREFAQALKTDLPGSLRHRHLVPIAEQDRIAYFISHANEHYLLVREMVGRLEAVGLRCWYYERDAIPDIPYARQSRAALSRSAAAVVLISKQTIHSLDSCREAEDAFKLGCRIVPLFVDATADDFLAISSPWQVFLASTPQIHVRRALGGGPAAAALLAASQELGLEPAENVAAGTASPPRIQHYVWATDANQLDIGDLQHVVFRNELVSDFLQMRNKYFLAATKGLGKTLLLTYKRHLLAQDAHGQTLTMIPEGRPYLDMMDELRQLPKNFAAPLTDLSTSKRLWSAALRISALSYHAELIDAQADAADLREFPAVIRKWLGGQKIEPSVVFRELTNLSLSHLNRLLNDTENFLAKKMRSIHSGTCIFIDKVDQAIRGLSAEAWICVQAGLIEAAWDMMNANRHIRVYATIRQEAFSNYHSDIKSNLFGALTNLQYSEDDLALMMDQLAHCYEGCASFNDFVGFNVIRRPRRPAPEDCFHFVRRHTFGRPRDLVLIASEISARRASLDESRLSQIVHQLSATALINSIFSEVSVLLDCLGEEEPRSRFFNLLPKSILQPEDAIAICERFNGLEAGTLRQMGLNSSGVFHPFRDLYVAGLLGVIEQDPESELRLQRFRQPHDYLPLRTVELPRSEHYLLHPALTCYLTMVRQRTEYLVFQHLTVGQGLPWLPSHNLIMQIESIAERLAPAQFREVVHRLLNLAQSILDSGNLRLLRYDVETSSDWQQFGQFKRESGYDELAFAFDELLQGAAT